jgi:hypothetical protein
MLLAILCAAAAGNVVAVLPMDARPGSLEPAEVAGLQEELRAVAAQSLPGFSLLDAEQTAAAPKDPRKALESLKVAALVFGIVAKVEGGTVMAIGVYKSGSPAPAGSVRISGNAAELKQGIRDRVPAMLKGAGISPLKAPSEAAAPQRPPAEPALSPLIQEVTSDVEALRGLRRKSSLKVQILDDKLFAAALRAKAEKELPRSAGERMRWLAFDLAPPAADPATLLTVLDEQASAFFDPFNKQLVVRKDAPGGENLRLVLAHEIEHALQQQYFGFPDPVSLPDDDARLARLALYEGDAMTVSAAYGARRARKHLKAAIISAAALLRAAQPEVLFRAAGYSPALLKAPAILREEVAVRYGAGFGLVAEVYRRGGFALVDRMFANPPATSHQVLHPEAYLAGEAPVAIASPPAPKGTRVVASGHLGEAAARVMLGSCVDKSVARDAVAHWAGDTYIVVEGARRALSLVWLSAWSAGTAESVSNLIRLQSPCWQQSAAAGGLPAAARVRTGGDFVAVARGSVDLDPAAAAALGTRTAPGKAVPPFGDIAATSAPARIEEGRFTSAWLALEGLIPEGYQPDPGNPTAEVSIRRPGVAGGNASVSLLGEALAGEALEKFFETASAQIAAAQGGHPSLVSKAQRLLAEGTGEERIWKIEGPGVQLHIQVGSFCSGKASLALVSIESSDAAKAALDRFASSIKPTGAAPACSDLE